MSIVAPPKTNSGLLERQAANLGPALSSHPLRDVIAACFPAGGMPAAWSTTAGPVTRTQSGLWSAGVGIDGETVDVGSARYAELVVGDCVLHVLHQWTLSSTRGLVQIGLQRAAVDGQGPLATLLAETGRRARAALPTDTIELYRTAPAGTPMWPLVSWTSQRRIVRQRADLLCQEGVQPIIVATSVPSSKLAGAYLTGLGAPEEHEYVTTTVEDMRQLGSARREVRV